MRKLVGVVVCALVLGCQNTELARLKQELEVSRAEAASLRALLQEEKGSAPQQATSQEAPASALGSTLPQSTETPKEPLVPKEENATDTESLAALKALKAKKSFEIGDVSVKVIQSKTARTWPFDRHGDSYMYREADKDKEFLYLDFQVTSKETNPKLPIFVVYTIEDGKVSQLDWLYTRFYKWEDYGTYLGNYHDSRNDFAKRETIKFTAGLAIKKEVLKNAPVFVGAFTTPCQERKTERFANPPVSYTPVACFSLLPLQASAKDLLEKFEPVLWLNQAKIEVEEQPQ